MRPLYLVATLSREYGKNDQIGRFAGCRPKFILTRIDSQRVSEAVKVTENGNESEEELAICTMKYRLAREGCTMGLEQRIIALERALEALLRREEDMKNKSKLQEWYAEDDSGWY